MSAAEVVLRLVGVVVVLDSSCDAKVEVKLNELLRRVKIGSDSSEEQEDALEECS